MLDFYNSAVLVCHQCQNTHTNSSLFDQVMVQMSGLRTETETNKCLLNKT